MEWPNCELPHNIQACNWGPQMNWDLFQVPVLVLFLSVRSLWHIIRNIVCKVPGYALADRAHDYVQLTSNGDNVLVNWHQTLAKVQPRTLHSSRRERADDHSTYQTNGHHVNRNSCFMKRLPQLPTPISDNQAQELHIQPTETDVRTDGAAQPK